MNKTKAPRKPAGETDRDKQTIQGLRDTVTAFGGLDNALNASEEERDAVIEAVLTGKTFPQRRPNNLRGGRPAPSFAERYAAEPDGVSRVSVPNVTLAYLERIAGQEGLTVVEWLNRLEINSRIL